MFSVKVYTYKVNMVQIWLAVKQAIFNKLKRDDDKNTNLVI